MKNLQRFYSNLENVWPDNDRWHIYTHLSISDFVKKHVENITDYKKLKILNCGSGGITYGLDCDMYHMDIVENKISAFPHWKVASAEKIPFEDNEFDIVICVGTVINYCNAADVVREISRVLRPEGRLYLEFETSGSAEYIFSHSYFRDKGIVKSRYFGEEHIFWVYSFQYIRKLLHIYNIHITEKRFMHIISPFVYRIIPSENFAGLFSIFDSCLQKNSLRIHAANIIIEAVKG